MNKAEARPNTALIPSKRKCFKLVQREGEKPVTYIDYTDIKKHSVNELYRK